MRIERPEDIRLLDPASGSGHMLTYAFDLLVKIYEEEGYAPSQIAKLILTHNLYGLDICPRAAQLAQFALLCKARGIDRRFFRRSDAGGDAGDREQGAGDSQGIRPNVLCLEEIDFAEGELPLQWLVASDQWVGGSGQGPGARDQRKADLFHDLHLFREAKNFGSLLQPKLSEAQLAFLKQRVSDHWPLTPDPLLAHSVRERVLRVLEQAEALTQRYHVVVMNPPYLGGNQMNGGTKAFAEMLFPNSKADLFAMFIERAFTLAVPMGFSGMITMQSWMFLSTFEDFRAELLAKKLMHNMAHLGPRAFDSIGGEVVQATAFIYENVPSANRETTFLRLTAGRCEADKAAACREAIANPNCGWLFHASASDFRTIPGSSIAYWLSAKALDAFRSNSFLADLAPIREGINTGDNARFLRFWFEAVWSRIDFAVQHNGVPTTKWVPHKKGGGFRRWYGNADYILNWERGGVDIHAFHGLPLTYNGAPMRGKAYFFKHSLSWSRISTANFCIRQYPSGFSYDSTAPSIYGPADSESFVLGFLNSHVVGHLMAALSPTLDYRLTSVGRLPLLLENTELRKNLTGVPEECVKISRADWDNFETSWDFKDLPMLRNYEVRIMNYEGEAKPTDSGFITHTSSFIIKVKAATLAESWSNYAAYCTAAIRRMQELETENNRLFIAAYGLDGELQPEVPEEQITLARADQTKDAAALLSYAVGCMFGRYSLLVPGLVLADAGSTLQDYDRIVRTKYELGSMNDEGKAAAAADPDFIIHNSSFIPDADGILPVLDGEWFPDDVVARTREFLKVVWGAARLDENVAWLEQALQKDLRKYFVRDFYKNHLSNERAYGYKKRPIYWLVSSPGGSFQALLYLHRYTRDTVNTLLNNYLREFIHKLDARLNHLTHVEATTTSAREKTAARKEADKLRKSVKECQDWEREVVLPLAQQRIALDLDDGVKANYQKFPGLLAKIPGLERQQEE